MAKAKKEREARKAEKEEIKAKKLLAAKEKFKKRRMEGMKPETELKKLTEYGDPEKKLLEYFETYHGNYKQYYGGRLLNPKNNNFWNLCLLFLCKYVEFITPSTKAYSHSVYRTWNQEFLNQNPSMRSFVDSIGKKDALGQMKHNTKDLKIAIEDYFMKKQRDIYDPSTESTPKERYKELQDLEETIEKRDKVIQGDLGYSHYRENMRRLRKKASDKIKSGFSSLKKSLSKRFGREQGVGASTTGGGRKRKNKRNKKKTHKKSIKRKPKITKRNKTTKRTKKKNKKHSRRP